MSSEFFEFYSYPMDFDTVQFHQVLVIDALKDFQFFGYVFDGFRFARLDGDLFHCHQFTR